ncbi:DUF3515 family protein [Nocardia sp. NBC_01009]|nr:DUF3515 family protein [Nocardia sp. NBC_01009]
MAANSSKPDSSETNSSQADSPETGPSQADSWHTEPAQTEPAQADSSQTDEVAQADSSQANPAQADSSHPDRSQVEPSQPEPSETNSHRADASAGTPERTAANVEADAASGSESDTTASDKGATSDSESSSNARPYPPALIATAVALPVVLIVAILVAAVLARNAPTEREPLVLGPVPAPAADGTACTTLLPVLPVELGDYTKSQLVEPAPPATRAWQRSDGGDPIVLRCGLDRPLEFNRASALQIVNGVQWFEARDPASKASTWFAVDRETYIALTIPDGSGPTPLQAVSDAITADLPAKAIDPGPLPN